MMNIEEYLSTLPKFSNRPGLDNVKEAFKRLKLKPSFNFIHIAGTKGKGSTASFIANILESASYKTGLFLSPHLVNIRERISINGEYIDKESFSRAYEKIDKDLQLNFFETLFVIAQIYFQDMGVQFAVIETGLGGRLDPTNIIEKPLVSVLTTIGLDHLDVLGDSIEKIAIEKAGIIKSCSPVISAPQQKNAEKVITDIANSLSSPLYFIGKDFEINRQYPPPPFEERFSLYSKVTNHNYEGLTLSLLGNHQVINASLAVASSEILNKLGYLISDESSRNGLKSAKIRGRFEVLQFSGRTLILDGAHNIDSAKALSETINERFKGKDIVFVIAILRNKLAKDIISILNKDAKMFIFTELKSNDTFSTYELKEFLNDIDPSKDAVCIKDSTEALIYIMENSTKDCIICITGSLYLVGDIINFLDDKTRKQR